MNRPQLNILIADDEPLMRGLLTSYLQTTLDHKIFKAVDGNEALNFYTARKDDIHIVFLDIEMPRINGLEVLSKIKAINPNVFVVMVSAFSSIENVKTAMAAGVNGFIVKPYTNAKIDEVLSNYEKVTSA